MVYEEYDFEHNADANKFEYIRRINTAGSAINAAGTLGSQS